MATMTLVYSQPSGYFSGSSPADKTVSRISVSGAPSDSYSNYKVTNWTITYQGQVYTSYGVTADFTTNGASLSVNMGEEQTTVTFTRSGTSLSNKILNSAATSALTVGISRNGGSGSGNAALFKSNITITVEYDYAYTACSAPSSVTVSNSSPTAGATVKLSWSGAKAGTINAIKGYEVYRATASNGSYSLLKSITSTATSGSLDVTAPASMGGSYYYKIKTKGTVSGYDSGYSAAVGITAKTFTACAAPTSLTVSSATIDSGSSFTLGWSGAAAGTNNAITAYQIYHSTDNENYILYQTAQTNSTSGSLSIKLTTQNDTKYYYKVVTVGTVEGYNSGYSNAATVQVLTYTNCGGITLTVSATLAEQPVTLNWNQSTDGRNNPVAGYKVQYQDSVDGVSWGVIADVATQADISYTAALNPVRGHFRRYMITPVGTKAGFDGTTATSAAIRTNQVAAAPTLIYPLDGTTTNSKAPKVKVSLAAEPDAQNYEVWAFIDSNSPVKIGTANSSGGDCVFSLPQLATGQHTVSIKANDGLADTNSTNTVTIIYEPAVWGNNNDAVMANDITTLRNYTNNLRQYCGKPIIEWEETITANTTLVKASHWTEIQQAINEAQPQTFKTVKKGDLIKKAVLAELRTAITGG